MKSTLILKQDAKAFAANPSIEDATPVTGLHNPHLLFAAALLMVMMFFSIALKASEDENNPNRYNSSTTFTMAFFNTDTILVVIPDNEDASVTINEINSNPYFKSYSNQPVYFIKTESELKKHDGKKHLLFYGSINDFKREDLFHTPFSKTENGFRLNKKVFNQPQDAFFYVNRTANRMYICRNSTKENFNILKLGIGAYPMHIFSGKEIVCTGIYKNL